VIPEERPIFQGFPKLARLFGDITITEKIDGTNAAVVILSAAEVRDLSQVLAFSDDGDVMVMFAQSRTRLITPEDDNFGFAKWVQDNQDELWRLGPGHHFGEWWGKGIQRNYGLNERRFSLFNTARWPAPSRPACCHTVPVLMAWKTTSPENFAAGVGTAMADLALDGSWAAPGWGRPEGIVVYHGPSKRSFKYTLDGDGHKGGVRE
jgi:hypothetical protein